jgi:hypothetical protein
MSITQVTPLRALTLRGDLGEGVVLAFGHLDFDIWISNGEMREYEKDKID